MKILGKAYTGTCLRLSVPLDLERSLLRGLRTEHQKASALYWLQFWHESLGRAIVLNRRNRRPVQNLKNIASEYALMIAALKEGTPPSIREMGASEVDQP